MNKTKQMTTLAMCIALAVIFHTIENQIPLPSPIPGYHLGLANIVGLVVLYKFDDMRMMSVNLLRVLFASLLNGMIFSYVFWMSFICLQRLCGYDQNSWGAECGYLCLLYQKSPGQQGKEGGPKGRGSGPAAAAGACLRPSGCTRRLYHESVHSRS